MYAAEVNRMVLQSHEFLVLKRGVVVVLDAVHAADDALRRVGPERAVMAQSGEVW